MKLVLLYHLDGNAKSAAKELSALLGCNPRHASAWLLCAIMLERQGGVVE